MGFLIGAFVLIGIIAFLSKKKFQNRRPCPKCSHENQGLVRSCVNCGYVFPIGETLDDDDDEEDGDDGGDSGGE